jgi:hypothetical protein
MIAVDSGLLARDRGRELSGSPQQGQRLRGRHQHVRTVTACPSHKSAFFEQPELLARRARAHTELSPKLRLTQRLLHETPGNRQAIGVCERRKHQNVRRQQYLGQIFQVSRIADLPSPRGCHGLSDHYN